MKKMFVTIILLAAMITGCAGNSGGNNGENPVASNSGKEKQMDSIIQTPAKEYIQPEMKGEITVSVLDDSELLNTAAELFMDKYPDVKVTVNTFRKVDTVKLEGGAEMSGTPSEEFSTENYLNLLNTKIMTGKAEDIIMTDPLPLRKYTEMGAFEDLSFFMSQSPEINNESHYMNVFEIMKDKNGSLYQIPLTWGPAQIISFDEKLVEDSKLFLEDSIQSMSYTEALEYAKKLVDNTSRDNTYLEMGSSSIHSVFSIMNDNLKDFIDFENKKVNINNERFINILQHAKKLEDTGYYDTNKTIDFYNMEYHFALGTDFGAQAAYYALLPNTGIYRSMPLSDAEGNIGANAYPCFGINSASKNKELSWEFIKFLLSKEIQTLPSVYGFGVNKEGFDAFSDRILRMYNDGNGLNITKQEYEDLIKGWMSQINCYNKTDPAIINQFIYPELEKFFSQEQSAEDTAKILQSKLDKYLNE